ncbi:sigma-70 family RNA polymerase sigma factor [Sphingomonas oligophenolica]|uniref:Sigma-70 family RNA polymerase sigma factor n=2 Tax=Sphingomonas oligophenolica TaxID=301154 RepID=A0A502CHN1_9SPHN|nr:sigma-70 family RNA polymerase sigma factor [Sphingomonas oligophenolica]
MTSARLFGICLRVCGERQAAEDVLHDVYQTIWQRAGAWDPAGGSAMTWLASIARDHAIAWRRASEAASRALPIDDAVRIVDRCISTKPAQPLEQCLAKLDPRQRHAICAAFFDGATYPELAGRQGISIDAMKRRIREGPTVMRHDFFAAETDERALV